MIERTQQGKRGEKENGKMEGSGGSERDQGGPKYLVKKLHYTSPSYRQVGATDWNMHHSHIFPVPVQYSSWFKVYY